MKKLTLLISILTLLVLLVPSCSPTPKVNVALAATLPTTQVGPGEHTIFRFVVATTKDTEIESLVLKIGGEAKVRWLQWYDENQGIVITTASYQTSEHQRVTIWPMMQTVTIAAGTTKTFSIRGEVSGQGWLSAQLVDVRVKKGNIEGLPSATTVLEIH